MLCVFRQRIIACIQWKSLKILFGIFHKSQREKGRFVYISFNVISGSKFRGREKEKSEKRERKKRKKIKKNFQNESL